MAPDQIPGFDEGFASMGATEGITVVRHEEGEASAGLMFLLRALAVALDRIGGSISFTADEYKAVAERGRGTRTFGGTVERDHATIWVGDKRSADPRTKGETE